MDHIGATVAQAMADMAGPERDRCRECGAPTRVIGIIGGRKYYARLCPEHAAAEEAAREKAQAKAEALAREQAMARRRERILDLMAEAGVPPIFRTARLADWTKVPVPYGRGWYGWGPWGCGKTYLAAAHLRESLLKTGSGLFVEAPMFFLELNSTFGRDRDETALDVFRRYIETPLLVFDDLDKVKLSEWVCRGLFLILNGRWSAGRLTIITANVRRTKMIERIAAVDWELAGAIDSRLKALCPEVPLNGRDRRNET